MKEPNIDFAWSELYQQMGEAEQHLDMERCTEILTHIAAWLALTPNPRGMLMRAIILCRMVDHEPTSLRTLAARYHVSYQSLNRAQHQFYLAFPQVRVLGRKRGVKDLR